MRHFSQIIQFDQLLASYRALMPPTRFRPPKLHDWIIKSTLDRRRRIPSTSLPSSPDTKSTFETFLTARTYTSVGVFQTFDVVYLHVRFNARSILIFRRPSTCIVFIVRRTVLASLPSLSLVVFVVQIPVIIHFALIDDSKKNNVSIEAGIGRRYEPAFRNFEFSVLWTIS